MVEKQRDDSGQFSAEVTDDDILAAVRAHEPAATSEIAGEVGMSRQGTDRRLRRLRDAGRVSSKKIAASLVWFDARPDGAIEGDEHAQDAGDGDRRGEQPAPGNDDSDAGVEGDHAAPGDDPLDHVEFPEHVDHADGVDAVRAAVEAIETDGPLSKGEVVAAIMPEHPLGYNVDDAIEKVETSGERYRGAWWRKVVQPGLKAIDGVEYQNGVGWRSDGSNT